MDANYQSTEDWQLARETNNLRCVDVFIASLWRNGHVVTTIESLLRNPEVLTITVVANNYTDEQMEDISRKIVALNYQYQIPIFIHRGDNAKESNEKLKYIHHGHGKYISFVDDDLILPAGYYQYMIKGCETYNAYVSLHGVLLFPRPIRSYYRDRQVFRGLGRVLFDNEVDIASNCGSLFKREFFSPALLKDMYQQANDIGMDDIHMAYWCKQNGIRRMVLAHPEGFLKHKKIEKGDNYIFDKYALTGNDGVQTNFINKYWDI